MTVLPNIPSGGSKESQLVDEIKKRHPLKGVIPIFKKYGYDIRDANSKAIFLMHNLNYLTPFLI